MNPETKPVAWHYGLAQHGTVVHVLSDKQRPDLIGKGYDEHPLYLHPSRPPADWSAAAREICDKVLATLEAGGVKYTIRSEWYGEVEAIIRKHAQSQPSAPVGYTPIDEVVKELEAKDPQGMAEARAWVKDIFASPVPSQEPVEPIQLFMCEIPRLTLKPGHLYIFGVDPECEKCAAYLTGDPHE